MASLRKHFNPVEHGLSETFRITQFTHYRGCGGKVPQKALEKLLSLLKPTDSDDPIEHAAGDSDKVTKIGIGLDCSVTPLDDYGLCLTQTTDILYPLVDDPYMMGKIACANTLSDLYAVGVQKVDNMLMILCVSDRMSDKERDVAITEMMRGFRDLCQDAGCGITGGQTILNPWICMGGIATSVCRSQDIIYPDGAVSGDAIILTKPLGIRIVANVYQWRINEPDNWNRLISHGVLTDEDATKAYNDAMYSMARLNKTGAMLMHKYGAHCCTDVTGFGLIGHAVNLAKSQKNEVTFVINTMPVFAKMAAVDREFVGKFKLDTGLCAETSGGLLVVLPKPLAKAYCEEIERIEGLPAWVIGEVVSGNRDAILSKNVKILDV